MKKRLLSMLLLVAMVVTAIPLVALPAVAAEAETEEKEYTAAQYNDLYVKTGLIYAVDFFGLNSYWKTEYTSIPVGPSENTAYVFNDEPVDLTKQENRYGWGLAKSNAWIDSTVYPTKEEADNALAAMSEADRAGITVVERITPAFEKAYTEWKNADRAYYKQFESVNDPSNNSSNPMYTFSYWPTFGPGQNTDSNDASNFVGKVFTIAVEHDGYITIRTDKHTSGGLQMANLNYHKPTTAMSQQLIAAFSGTIRNAFTIFADVRPSVSVSGGKISVIGNAGSFTTQTHTPTELTFANSDTEVVDFTLSLEYAAASGTSDGTVIGRTEDGELFTDKGTYTPNNSMYFGWSNTAPDIKIYAYRHYSTVLTQDEVAQNHFADLAKFYRLDLSQFEGLTAEEMKAVYEAAVPFALGTADRDALAEALYAKALEARQARYEVYEGQLDAAILEVGKTYLLDLDLILGIPRGVLPATYTLLNAVAAGTSASTDVAADYAAAVEADFAAYAASSTMTADAYNAYYVQNGLVYAVDFFASNAHWGGGSRTYTVNDTFKADLLNYQWKTTSGINWGALSSGKSITIGNGYIDLSQANDIQITGVGGATGNGFASGSGATAEQVMRAIGGGYMFNNVRAYFSSTSHAMSSAEVQNNGFQFLKNNPTYNGQKITTNAFTTPVSLAMVMSVTDPTYSALWGGKEITGQTNSTSVAAYVGTYETVAGETEPVLSVAATTTNVAPFFQPSMKKVAEVWYQDGAKLEEPLTDVYVYFPDEQSTLGFFGLYENGNTLYENDETPFLNNKAAYDAAYVKWSSCTSDLYAVRYYGRTLSPVELANNHFVDVAKFFRLNIAGYESLSEEAQAEVAAALADINFSSDRVEAQSAILRALAPAIRASYDAMKIPGETAWNAFLDVAADYLLDVSAVMTSKRDMSSVFETVTAEALIGKTAAEAQAILDEAYADAYYYLSYKADADKENAAKWNGQLAWCAENLTAATPVNLDKLATLPWSVRSLIEVPTGSVEEAQAAIDTFVADALAAYGDTADTDYDYDSLYVKNGLIFQVDFFKTNEYWNTDGIEYKAPVGPSENTAYLYDNGTPSDTSDDVTVDLTKPENRYGWGLARAKAWIDDTVYATKEEADAALAALDDSTVTVVERATPAFLAAYSKWSSADKAYLKNFVVTQASGNAMSIFSYVPSFGAGNTASYNVASFNTAKTFSAFTQGAGYLQLRDDLHSSGGFQFSGTSAFASDFLSVQFTAALGGAAITNKTLQIFHNIRPTVSVSGGLMTMTGIATNNFAASGAVTSNFGVKNSLTDVISMTTTLEGLVDADENDRFLLRTPAGVMASVEGKITPEHNNHYFSYGGALPNMRIYAIRYYNAELSETDLLQNHFADLAKFFRLDLTLLASLSAAQLNKVYAAFASYDIGTAARAELQAAFDAIAAEIYDGIELVEDADANRAFLKLAAAGALDVARIKNLSADGREVIVSAMLEEFAPAYTVNKAVLNALYDELTYSLGALTFAGYQVRIDTGAASQNYAGVRAVFDVNEEIVKALAADETVALTIAISMNGAVGSTIAIAYDAESDSLKATMTTGDETQDAILYERTLGDGSTVTSVNYTVVYRGDAANAENFAAEYTYSYAISVGSTTIDFAVNSQTFGESVSAFELYEYFAGLEEYADDRVIESVLALAD